MKNGEAPAKVGATRVSTAKASGSTKTTGGSPGTSDASKKRFGLKGKPPPPAPRQPRARQRLSVTVLGTPGAERPMFEDPLLSELQAKAAASAPGSATSVLEVPFDLSWPPPATDDAGDSGTGLVNLSWPSPTSIDAAPLRTPKATSRRPSSVADDTAATLEAQFDLSWPSPAPAPRPGASDSEDAATALDATDAERDLWPEVHQLDIPVELRVTPPTQAPKRARVEIPFDLGSASTVELPAMDPPRLEVPLDLSTAPPVPVDLSLSAAPPVPSVSPETTRLAIPRDLSPTPPVPTVKASPSAAGRNPTGPRRTTPSGTSTAADVPAVPPAPSRPAAAQRTQTTPTGVPTVPARIGSTQTPVGMPQAPSPTTRLRTPTPATPRAAETPIDTAVNAPGAKAPAPPRLARRDRPAPSPQPKPAAVASTTPADSTKPSAAQTRAAKPTPATSKSAARPTAPPRPAQSARTATQTPEHTTEAVPVSVSVDQAPRAIDAMPAANPIIAAPGPSAVTEAPAPSAVAQIPTSAQTPTQTDDVPTAHVPTATTQPKKARRRRAAATRTRPVAAPAAEPAVATTRSPSTRVTRRKSAAAESAPPLVASVQAPAPAPEVTAPPTVATSPPPAAAPQATPVASVSPGSEVALTTPSDTNHPVDAPGWPSLGEFAKAAATTATAEPVAAATDDDFRPYRAVSERDAKRHGDAADAHAIAEQIEREAAWERAAETDEPDMPAEVMEHDVVAAIEQRWTTLTSGGDPAPGADVRNDSHSVTANADDLRLQSRVEDEQLEARLEAAERELRRLETRTNQTNGDLRNARRREIAAAVRQVLADDELTSHFELLLGDGRFEFHRRGPGISSTAGPIRRLVAEDGGDAHDTPPAAGPQIKRERSAADLHSARH